MTTRPLPPLLAASIRSTRTMFVIAALGILAAVALSILAIVYDDTATRGMAIGLGVFAGVCGLLEVWAVYKVAQHWVPERAPVARILLDRPDDVVWIYVQEVQGQAYGVQMRKHNIKLALADGRTLLTLSVPHKRKDELLELLARLAPRAVFGYSRELAKRYKQDPRALAA